MILLFHRAFLHCRWLATTLVAAAFAWKFKMLQLTAEILPLAPDARIQNALGRIAGRAAETICNIGQLHDAAGVGKIQVITGLAITAVDFATTGGQQQTIEMDDIAATKAAVEALPITSLRQIVLSAMLDEIPDGMA